MGYNSIHSNLSKEDIIAEIRLTLAADFEHEKIIIIVEGEDDIQFFNGKLHQDVDVRESFSGKCGVSEIVNYFSDDRVIGIRDIDYDVRSSSPQLFYYDYCCLEMMLISNDSVFSPFFYTYYHGSKRPGEIKLFLLSNLKWLSLYRRLSAEKRWNINFRGLSLKKALDTTTHKLNIANLLCQINKLNPGLAPNNREYLRQISLACREEYDQDRYLHITQGHDFLHYFQSLCELVKYRKGKSPNTAELFRSLVCSYRKENFIQSNLYQELVNYQITYKLKVL